MMETEALEQANRYIRCTLKAFGITQEEFAGRCRVRYLVMAREIVAAHCYYKLEMSLWGVGGIMDRTSASVYNYLENYEADRSLNATFKKMEAKVRELYESGYDGDEEE